MIFKVIINSSTFRTGELEGFRLLALYKSPYLPFSGELIRMRRCKKYSEILKKLRGMDDESGPVNYRQGDRSYASKYYFKPIEIAKIGAQWIPNPKMNLPAAYDVAINTLIRQLFGVTGVQLHGRLPTASSNLGRPILKLRSCGHE